MSDALRNEKIALIGFGILSAAAAYQTIALLFKRGNDVKTSKDLVKKWKPVARVSSLHIHPIKSCHDIVVEEAEAEPMGLSNGELKDRSFLVVNANNNFLHARIHPEMVLIKVAIANGQMTLNGPGMEQASIPLPPKSGGGPTRTVRIWGEEVNATDCGDVAAKWFSEYIFKKESGARLVHVPYAKTSPRQVKQKAGHPWMKPADGAIFSDTTPFHLMSTESADDLNSRLPESCKITTRSFRPTIAISGCSKPYEEDDWIFIRIGDNAVFRFVKHCDRCILTTINPETGIKHPEMEPLRTLKTYRQAEEPVLRSAIGESPLLGVNLTLAQPGRIRVGDIVYAGEL